MADSTTALGPGPENSSEDAVAREEPSERLRISLGRVIAITLVALFFGGAVGYVIGEGRPPAVDSVDVGFYRDMTAHHDQAVRIASIELRNGTNTVVRGFAYEIVLGQRWEMGRMYEQLSAWHAPTSSPDTAMGWMGMPVPSELMPGMATEEQLEALRDAKGAEADALFLDLIAEHHRGGAHMAAYAAENAKDADVRELARVMARNQSIEIAEYRQTAERLGFDIVIDPYDPDAHISSPG